MNSQTAITLLKNLEQSLDGYCELNDEGKTAFGMAITALELFGISEQLPSVHPELSNNSPELDIKNGDLISRQAAIDALDEIRHALWEIDIPSPTVPEYVEHHEQVQSVWKLLDKKQKELYVLPSVQPQKGKWIDIKHTFMTKCSVCDWINNDDSSYNFCPNCGADMRGDSDD